MSKEAKNRVVSVDGKKLAHKIGDYPFIIDFGEDEFSPHVDPLCYAVEKIVTTATGVQYYSDDNYLLDSTCPLDQKNKAFVFWTEKEAQEWLEDNLPQKQTFNKAGATVFIVGDNGAILKAEVRDMRIVGDRFGYGAFIDERKYFTFFTEDEIGRGTYLTYKEAKEARDVAEALKFAEYIKNE